MKASNYFDLFGLKPRFNIDKFALKQKYFELSREFHPDFGMHLSSEEQAKRVTKTGEINNGLKVLEDPQETIKYLLICYGYLEQDQKEQLSPEFLMEMMDMNEKLMEISFNFDQQTYMAAKNELGEYLNEIHLQNSSLQEQDPSELSDMEWKEIKENYFKSRYLLRIQEKMNTLALPNKKTL